MAANTFGGLPGIGRATIDLGLERMGRLLDALGRPDRILNSIVHVAGTNGKGSVAAMTAAMLQASGRRTALYTSPPLSSDFDSFVIDGKPISPAVATRLTRQVQAASELIRAQGVAEPTQFEAATALMYLWCAEQQVDVLVQEAGLGGRLDATNAAERIALSIITNVALDHRQWLGDTTEGIAAEKAAIARSGVPLITAATGAALQVIARAAAERGAPLFRVGRNCAQSDRFCLNLERMTTAGTEFAVQGPYLGRQKLRTALLGEHQALNAATAAAAAAMLGVPQAAIARGLERVRWPGRIELLAQAPPVVVDGAHNPAAMAALRRTLEALFPSGKLVLVIGMTAGKDAGTTAAVWRSSAARIVVVEPPVAEPLNAQELSRHFAVHGLQVETFRSWQAGLTRGLELASGGYGFGRCRLRVEESAAENYILCVCGSLHLIEPARRWFSSCFNSNGV